MHNYDTTMICFYRNLFVVYLMDWLYLSCRLLVYGGNALPNVPQSWCHHTSVDSSAPSNLLPRVQLRSMPSMLFSFIVKFVIYLSMRCEKRTKINKKEAGFGPFFKKIGPQSTAYPPTLVFFTAFTRRKPPVLVLPVVLFVWSKWPIVYGRRRANHIQQIKHLQESWTTDCERCKECSHNN